MKWLILLLAFFASDPSGELIISETSDYVEINHVYREDLAEQEYKKRMIQVIWWEWKNSVLLPVKDSLGKETGHWRRSGCFIVRDFRVIWSESSSPQQTLSIAPRREGKDYICLFYDKDNGVIRRIRSGWLIITHTINDREIDNRQVIRVENRNKLINPQKN
tara:strand:- start:1329 stop:1814 length:486 start_codon:yes stop_codon:yes gene_type:complete